MRKDSLITIWLEQFYDEIDPILFYQNVFNIDDFQEKGVYEKGKYNPIIVEIDSNFKRNKIMRHTVTKDLDKLREVINRDNFCLMSPITYVGKSRISENARVLYAIAVDLDGIKIKNDKCVGLVDLVHQIEDSVRIPKPTYIVSSGTGVHLYYVLKEPILLFENIVKQLQVFKRELTRLLWNGYITDMEDNVQYESLFQGFRVVGTVTKHGSRTKAFEYGDKVDMFYLNTFVAEKYKVKNLNYKSKLSLSKAKKIYPEWYEERIVQKKPRKYWTADRAVYDWWKKKIYLEAKVGHRYYCLMMLSVYAKKCGIEREELENDAFSIMDYLDSLTIDKDNFFGKSDVLDALEAYNSRYITYPINSISYLTDIRIEKNKRNYLKQEVHLKLARDRLKSMRELGLVKTKENSKKPGAKPKGYVVKEWRKLNPKGKKAQCIRETGLSKATVYKWWDS